MLYREQTTIKEIALSCGYRDVNYFCRTFKRATGLSPGAYRRTGIIGPPPASGTWRPGVSFMMSMSSTVSPFGMLSPRWHSAWSPTHGRSPAPGRCKSLMRCACQVPLALPLSIGNLPSAPRCLGAWRAGATGTNRFRHRRRLREQEPDPTTYCSHSGCSTPSFWSKEIPATSSSKTMSYRHTRPRCPLDVFTSICSDRRFAARNQVRVRRYPLVQVALSRTPRAELDKVVETPGDHEDGLTPRSSAKSRRQPAAPNDPPGPI